MFKYTQQIRNADLGRGRGLTNKPRPKIRPRRVKATQGWWVEGRAEGTFAAMLAAGFTADEAQAAFDRVWEEEEQRQAAEQRYLDSLLGWTPKRRGQEGIRNKAEETKYT